MERQNGPDPLMALAVKQGCVAKKVGGDKLRNSRSKFPLPNVQVQPVQVATLPSPNHPSLRSLVSQLSTVVPPSRRDGERTGIGYTLRNDISGCVAKIGRW